MIGNRGISAIVATVLTILITVVAVSIIWVAIIPMIKDRLDTTGEMVDLQIITIEGYTVYDSQTRLVSVQVKQGPGDVDLEGISFIFSFNGNSLTVVRYEIPGPNQKLTYHFNSSEFGKPASISIAPVFLDGRIGEISSTEEFVGGNLIDEGEEWVPISDVEVESCFYSNWVNQGCGLGSCGMEEMYQVRELTSGDGCIDVLERCNDADETCSLLTGAVSWWNFNGNFEDSIEENHGTEYGDAHIGNNELVLDGVDNNENSDYVLTGTTNFPTGTDSRTVSLWLKWNGGSVDVIYGYGDGTTGSIFGMYVTSSNALTFWGYNKDFNTGYSIVPGEWTHIVYTYNGTHVTTYADGVWEDSRAWDIFTVVDSSTIGFNKYTNNNPFDGTIDDLMIFDKELSGLEIKEIHDYQKAIRDGGGVLTYKQTGIGIEGMENFDELPYFKDNIQVLQFSSFDRSGGNSDGFTPGKYSPLYMENGNYVIFDEMGPGTVYNIWMAGQQFLDDDGRILFYFDNEGTPRVNMTLGDFFDGIGAPFKTPFNDFAAYTRYSLLPIQFKERLKVIMTEPPFFHHFTYHKYPNSVNIDSYDGTENYDGIENMWNNKGSHPTGDEGTELPSGSGTANIPGEGTTTLIDYPIGDYNYISTIKIRPPHDSSSLENLWLKIYFDGESSPSVYAPIGEFFGSGIGEVDGATLAIGMSTSEDYYSYFPMPFSNNVKIQIENKGTLSASVDYIIKAKKDSNMVVGENVGYFHAKYNKEFPTQKDKDYIFLDTTGRGHFVGVSHTMRGLGTNRNYLEGDERFFIDGKLSPNLYGTGTEDYYMGAYYFIGALPYYHAIFGVSRTTVDSHPYYSVIRLHVSDVIPFTSSVRLGIEHGSSNQAPSVLNYAGNYSSVAFYYGVDTPSTQLTDELDIGNSGDEVAHSYLTDGDLISIVSHQYPGYDTATPVSVSDDGKEFTSTGQSEFNVDINPDNKGVILRRRLDYSLSNQLGDVYVDGAYAGKWYTAGVHDIINPLNNIKWLDSDFHIPKTLTSGKSSVTIKIESSSWNEYYYWVYSKI